MKLLYEFDLKDYEGCTRRFARSAVRAIVFREGKLAMVFDEGDDCYKFPGGGIEPGESHQKALAREALEEAGLVLLPESIREYGMLHEIRKSTLFEDEIFDHTSYYYFAEAAEELVPQRLDEYEEALGYRLVYVPIREAYEADKVRGMDFDSTFILREAKVLELLLAQQEAGKENADGAQPAL